MTEDAKELTEKEKIALLEKLGFTLGQQEHRGLFYKSNHGRVLVGRSWHKRKDGRYIHTYDYFNLDDMSQCMLMLEGLAKVSGWKWCTQNLPSGMTRLYADRKEHPYCPYDRYGEDLCELIRDAVCWWIENNK